MYLTGVQLLFISDINFESVYVLRMYIDLMVILSPEESLGTIVPM